MLKVGNDVLFQDPTYSGRRLRRSVVIATDQETISVRFVGEPFALAVDQEVLMFFTARREFMQQIGRITAIEMPAPPVADDEADLAVEAKAAVAAKEGPVFLIETVGDPISAENRQCYRVSTISAGIEAKFGKEANLPVQDLSATGFAVLAETRYEIGQIIDANIRLGEESCHGLVSVQSFRELESGRLRYGLRAIETDPHARIFLATLQRISLAVQREQLKRSGGVR